MNIHTNNATEAQNKALKYRWVIMNALLLLCLFYSHQYRGKDEWMPPGLDQGSSHNWLCLLNFKQSSENFNFVNFAFPPCVNKSSIFKYPIEAGTITWSNSTDRVLKWRKTHGDADLKNYAYPCWLGSCHRSCHFEFLVAGWHLMYRYIIYVRFPFVYFYIT